MIINCTSALQSELGQTFPLAVVENPLYSWHGNVRKIGRRKVLILVNDASGYVIAFYGMKAKDFKNIEDLFWSALNQELAAGHINPEIIEEYANKKQGIVFSKSQNRALVAKMNTGCKCVEVFEGELDDTTLFQEKICRNINYDFLVKNGNGYDYPNKSLLGQLGECFSKPAIRCKAIKVRVKMQLEDFDIWRELIFPLDITFNRLHDILQIAFEWWDYHWHSFTILDKEKAVIQLLEEADDFDDPLCEVVKILEGNVKVSEYLPKYKKLIYEYDFGDNWEHVIDVEDVILDYDKHYAVCLDGSGDAPPEDVGGETGLENFMNIINDPKHEDYEEVKEWGDFVRYMPFDINRINNRLEKNY
ncbi:MAG: plasmid pRiA4b ORF-3 family protein [Anaerovoracaceae bacterium]